MDLDFRFLVDSIPALAWSAAPNGDVDHYNARWCAYTGKTPEEMAGTGWYAVHHPDELERVVDTYRASLATGAVFELEHPLRAASGSFRWLLTRVTPIRDAQGAIVCWFATCTDIEDRRNAAREIAAALAREELALEDARRARAERADGVELAALATDVAAAFAVGGALEDTLQRCCEAVVLRIGAAFARVWTLSSDGATLELRASAGQYLHLDGAHARVPVGRFKIGRVAAERRAHVTNDVANDPWIGDPEWAAREGLVSFAGHPLIVEDNVGGVFALFSREPLTEEVQAKLVSVSRIMALGIQRKRGDQATAESEARYRFMADLVPAQVWTAGPDGQLDYVNAQALAYFGSTLEQTIGAGWLQFLHPDDVASTVERWGNALTSGEPYDHEFRLRGTDGSYRWHLVRATAFHDARGAISKWFGMNTDTEDQKRAQREHEKLIRALAQSNDELEQFASVASHDLKAPLRGIANLAEWIEEDLVDGASPTIKEQLRLMRSRVLRMSALIDGILSYARVGRDHQESETLKLKEVVDGVIELLAAPESVRFIVAADLPSVSSERVPLTQVLINIIGNAVKHAGRADPEVQIGWLDAGDFYALSVADNGQGIHERDQDKVWGMFQTLGPADKTDSTGIGLAVVKKLVTARGGRVWVESTPGRGARFCFLWPKHAAAR